MIPGERSPCDGQYGLRDWWPLFELLIIDELGFVPLSKTGAELLFEVLPALRAQHHVGHQQSAVRTEAFGSARLRGALLDRLTQHVHLLEMNGERTRLLNPRS